MRKSKDIRPQLIWSVSALLLAGGCSSGPSYTRYCVDNFGNRVADFECQGNFAGASYRIQQGVLGRQCIDALGNVVSMSYCTGYPGTGSSVAGAFLMRRWAYSTMNGLRVGSRIAQPIYVMPSAGNVRTPMGEPLDRSGQVQRGGFGGSSSSGLG